VDHLNRYNIYQVNWIASKTFAQVMMMMMMMMMMVMMMMINDK